MKRSVADFEADAGIVPIPLRPDLTVKLFGIPHNLTKAEADRIVSVILALGWRTPAERRT